MLDICPTTIKVMEAVLVQEACPRNLSWTDVHGLHRSSSFQVPHVHRAEAPLTGSLTGFYGDTKDSNHHLKKTTNDSNDVYRIKKIMFTKS